MKIEITNLATQETISITRDAATVHPAWVHQQLGTESESELQDALSNWSLAEYYTRSGDHKSADEYGVSLAAEESDYGYRITDGNATEQSDTLDEAESLCEDWYDYLSGEGKVESVPTPSLDASSIEALNQSIRAWEEEIAAAMGGQDFAGHGSYYVTAADQMGLNLRVEKVLLT